MYFSKDIFIHNSPINTTLKMSSGAIRYLNQDLVRVNRNGAIHQQFYQEAIVLESDVDWYHRITLFKNDEKGKVDTIVIPPPGMVFISFPIVIDKYYNGDPITNVMTKFATRHGVEHTVDFNIFPHISMQVLADLDIPLSDASSRISNVFGEGESSMWERVFEGDLDLRGVEYKRLNLGGLHHSRKYKIGESFPHQNPSSFIAKMTEDGELMAINFRGVKEERELKRLEEAIYIAEDEKSAILSDLSDTRDEYDANMKEIAVASAKLSAVHTEVIEEDKVSPAMECMTDPKSRNDRVMKKAYLIYLKKMKDMGYHVTLADDILIGKVQHNSNRVEELLVAVYSFYLKKIEEYKNNSSVYVDYDEESYNELLVAEKNKLIEQTESVMGELQDAVIKLSISMGDQEEMLDAINLKIEELESKRNIIIEQKSSIDKKAEASAAKSIDSTYKNGKDKEV